MCVSPDTFSFFLIEITYIFKNKIICFPRQIYYESYIRTKWEKERIFEGGGAFKLETSIANESIL